MRQSSPSLTLTDPREHPPVFDRSCVRRVPINEHHRVSISTMSQVQITAGGPVLFGVVLAPSVNRSLLALSTFVRPGLIFARVSRAFTMVKRLGQMLWNRTVRAPRSGPFNCVALRSKHRKRTNRYARTTVAVSVQPGEIWGCVKRRASKVVQDRPQRLMRSPPIFRDSSIK